MKTGKQTIRFDQHSRGHVFAGWLPCLLLAGLMWGAAANSDAAVVAGSTYELRGSAFEQPVVAVGDVLPLDMEAQELWALLNQPPQIAADGENTGLESYIVMNQGSPLVPSLRANLAKEYREQGRYTLALDHYEAAWEATRNLTDGPGRHVADFTLAHYTRLLASLGRLETLRTIFAEIDGRQVEAGPLQQMMNRTREAFMQMQSHPGVSYRCGTFALAQIARWQNGGVFDSTALLDIPSPSVGFSMAELIGFSDKLQLHLTAVARIKGDLLVVPSVIHWGQGHYAAIVGTYGPFYRVVDPTFGSAQYLTAAAINAEASGFFLISDNQLPAGWVRMTIMEASGIRGQGNPNSMVDKDNQQCNGCPCPPGGGGGGPVLGGGNGGNTSKFVADRVKIIEPTPPPPKPKIIPAGESACEGNNCGGMPVWGISEPYINLWLHDEPLGYQPAQGQRISLHLAFKQRDEVAGGDTGITGFGAGWNTPFISYIAGNNTYQYHTLMPTDVMLPGGGVSHFDLPSGQTTNYYNNLVLHPIQNGNGDVLSYELIHPDGAKDIYDFFRTDAGGSAWNQVFRTKSIDAFGHIVLYNYASYNPNTQVVKLSSVTDGDNRVTMFNYSGAISGFPNLVTSVTDPYSRTATLGYDTSGKLTSITDVASLASSITYNPTTGWPATLTTPYGTTSFAVVESGSADDIGYRSLTVTEPSGAKQLYAYLETPPFLPAQYPTGDIPAGVPVGTLDIYPPRRDSFYWNRQQYASLPSAFKSSTDFALLSAGDFLKSRMRHWLGGDDAGDYAAADTLSIERAPSPDGSAEGQKTFYDYVGKVGPTGRGTQILPSVVTRVLPDGTTWYGFTARTGAGLPTTNISTYTKTDGSIGTRTNITTYWANTSDVLESRGPNNELLVGRSYNAQHQILTETNAVGDVTSYTYDGSYRLSTRTLPTGLTTTYTYGTDGYVSQVSDSPTGTTESFTYYKGLVQNHTDERGLLTVSTSDDLQRLTRMDYPDATYTQNVYTYLDRTASRDRMGFWTYSTYNNLRQLTSTIDPLNRTNSYGYCDCGALATITNALGQVTTYYYDFRGLRTSVYYADATSIGYGYDRMGRLTSETDSLGSRTYAYNNQGLRKTINNNYGVEQSIIFDNEDRPVTTTDANGVALTLTYDNLGRLRTRTYPDTSVEQFGYSPRGMIAYTNQLGKVTTYGYDQAQRKTAETNANSEILSFTYNPASDLRTLTDGKSQLTSWGYDAEGRVTSKTNAANVEILRYTYDANARLATRWSKGKGTTSYTYDNNGNLTFVNYPASPDLTYAYDAVNRVTNMVDAAGTTKFTYTATGNLLTEDGPWSNDILTYTYHASVPRLRNGLTLQQSAGSWSQSYTYDSARRLYSITSPAGTFTYTYRGAGNLVTNLALPNTSVITNGYDTEARLTGTYLRNNAGTILNKHLYSYNTVSQRTQQTFPDASTAAYGYDNIGQLKSSDSSINTEDRGYVYDAAWNLTVRTNNGIATTFAVNNLNQLTSDPYGTDAYDNNGNVTSAGTSNGSSILSYDDENQLTSANVAASWRTDFVYDGLGRLRQRTEYTWNGTSWVPNSPVQYLYDGRLVIQERNYQFTAYTHGRDWSGSRQGAGGIGGLLARSSGYSGGAWSTHNYYHADGNGNITALVDGTQALSANYKYDPFGRTIASSGTLAAANVYRFSSKETHLNSGFCYYGYRFYDSNRQRWLNRDPIGERLGVNLYHFNFNIPINRIDRNGLESLPPIMPIGGGKYVSPFYRGREFGGPGGNPPINGPISALCHYLAGGGTPPTLGPGLKKSLQTLQKDNPWPIATDPTDPPNLNFGDYFSPLNPWDSLNVATSLGQFRYQNDGTDTSITDTYDFPWSNNDWSGGIDHHNGWLAPWLGHLGTPYPITGNWPTPQ